MLCGGLQDGDEAVEEGDDGVLEVGGLSAIEDLPLLEVLRHEAEQASGVPSLFEAAHRERHPSGFETLCDGALMDGHKFDRMLHKHLVVSQCPNDCFLIL